MNLIQAMFLCVMLMLCSVDVSGMSTTDPRWLLLPDRTVKVVIGSRMSLFWRYRLPSQIHKPGRLIFSHHRPGHSYEDLLIRGAVDPVSGGITPEELLYPDRLSLVASPGVIQVDLVMDSLTNAGHYMLDVDFAGESPIHDMVETIVYEEPKWLHLPEAETLASPHSHVTLTWTLNSSALDPSIIGVTITHVDMLNQTTIIQEAHKSYGLDTWTKSYSTRSGHDVTLDIHPDGTMIHLSLWELDEDDTGMYNILILFEDNIFQLQHRSWLYISTALGWIKAPPTDVYGMESHDIRLNYTPRIHQHNVTTTVKLSLFKMTSPMIEIISITYDLHQLNNNKHNTKRSASDSSQSMVLFDHDKTMTTFMLTNAQISDSGKYQVRMYTESQLTQLHNVTVTILTAGQMQPILKLDGVVLEGNTTFHIATGQLVIITPSGIPLPDIELYSLKGGTTHLYVKGFNVSFLEVMVTDAMLENDVMTLGVYHGFYHETYVFQQAATNNTVPFMSSANAIGVIVLIPLVIILVVLLVILARRKRRTNTEYKAMANESAVKMRTIRGRIPTYDSSSVKSSALHHASSAPNYFSSRAGMSVSSERDDGYHSNSVPRYRDSTVDSQYRVNKPVTRLPKAKLSLVIEQEKRIMGPEETSTGGAHSDSCRRRGSSQTSECSTPGRKSKSTVVIRSIYVRNDSMDRDQSFSSSSPRTSRSCRSSPSLTHSSTGQSGPQVFRYPSRTAQNPSCTTTRPRSNLVDAYSKSHDARLGSNDVFYPETNHLNKKPRSVSTLPTMTSRRPEEPNYKIRPSTGEQVHTQSVPAFLVKYRLREDELDTSVHGTLANKNKGESASRMQVSNPSAQIT